MAAAAARRRPNRKGEAEGKGKGKSKGKSMGKSKVADGAEGKLKANAEDDGDSHRCGNCDAPDAKSKCKGCGVEYYCNRECQTVGLGRR